MTKTFTVYPVKSPGTELEVKLAKMIGTSPGMIRYWAARLLTELKLERPLTPEEDKHVASRVYSSFPRVGTRYQLWPGAGA